MKFEFLNLTKATPWFNLHAHLRSNIFIVFLSGILPHQQMRRVSACAMYCSQKTVLNVLACMCLNEAELAFKAFSVFFQHLLLCMYTLGSGSHSLGQVCGLGVL